MARPIKIRGRWYLSQRVPEDVLVKMDGLPPMARSISLPIAGETVWVVAGEMVRVSLRTSDAKVAKARFAVADAALRRIWDAKRNPVADVVPKNFEQMTEDAAHDFYADKGILPTEAMIKNAAEEAREEYLKIMDAAHDMAGIKTNAASGRITMSALSKNWMEKSKASAGTKKRYRYSVAAFVERFGERDLRTMSSDDIFEWAQARESSGIKARTINSNDLTAISSIMKWATKPDGGKLLKSNPAKGVRLEAEDREVEDNGFSDDEVVAILRAASATEIPQDEDEADNPTLAYAKRWCPWLCAYTGARISEITALTGAQIGSRRGIQTMYVYQSKVKRWIYLPIQSHILDQGFLDFVRMRGDRPLFYDPARHNEKSEASPAQIRSGQLAVWIRSLGIVRDRIQPNHGWRHTFATNAIDVMPDRVSYTITGHAFFDVGGKYRQATLRQMSDGLENFPRYKI